MRQKLKDGRYRCEVCNYVRSLVMFVSIFVLGVCFVYVLLSWPDTKRQSVTRVKRMKEQADTDYDLCIDHTNDTNVVMHQLAAESLKLSIENAPLCVTPFGMLRCNTTNGARDERKKTEECDEQTLYYHRLDNINTEANKESVVRILGLEPRVCGRVCRYYVDMFEDEIHSQPHVSVLVLTFLILGICYFFLDCKASRNGVRIQALRISEIAPSHFHDTIVDPPRREFEIIDDDDGDDEVVAMIKQD